MAKKNDYFVFFVEGETEKEFYGALMRYYIDKFKLNLCGYKIINNKGIGRFESKVSTKLNDEVLPNHAANNIKVFCCYDTDVFELAQKPQQIGKL